MGAFDEVQYLFNDRLREALAAVPCEMAERAQEIRLCLKQPIALTVGGRLWRWEGCPRVTQGDLDEILRRMCDGALYSREEQVRQGYITLRGGHRAGLGGRFLPENGRLCALTSIALRLARACVGSADEVRRRMGETPHGLLLVGPPGSGKTTLLRDLARGWAAQGVRVGIADEREEIAGGFELGAVDVVVAPKTEAIGRLLRYMNPQVLLFDELGDQGASLSDCLIAGVKVVATLHAGNLIEAKRRLSLMHLPTDAFDVLVGLDGVHAGQIREWEWLHGLAQAGRDIADRVDPDRRRVS